MPGENQNKKTITFSEIALALANDYDSIFIINSEDDSYVEYLAEGDNKELVRRASGKNFYEDVIHDAREQVHPDDQDRFIESFKKEIITEILRTGKSFSINYRLMIEGKPYHYFLKTIKGSDKNVIIGVQNVDDQVKRQRADELERITYQHIAGALASRYEAIYYINVNTDAYTAYSTSDEYAKLGTAKEGTDFFTDMVVDVKALIYKEDVKFVISELQKENLLRNLELTGNVTLTYRQLLGDGTKYVTTSIVRPKNDPDHIVMGVANVDAQMKREQEMLEKNQIYNEMALALASRYEVLYRVNVNTNEYYEYSASSQYTKLDIGNRGDDFFADTQRNMKRDIYEEDYPMMARAMDKENLLRRLSAIGKVFLNYRLLLDGRPQYVNLVIIRPQEDSEHIIVALENIDEAKRREMEFEAAIGTAIDMANKDALTGVKNKHAYVSLEGSLDNEISSGESVEFAIAVCDINGLKQVNDEQGHIAGDEYIKEASNIICEVFDHSPVFRYGGDEFVVVLRGTDYKLRHELFKRLAIEQHINADNGKVTFAYGMSEFAPETDLRVQDVFERADSLMYENKRRFKGGIDFEDEAPADESYSFVRFYELYEQLLTEMVSFKEPNVPLIEDLLIRISTMFRLSKGITRVYSNPQEEREGKGEVLCCFDRHIEGVEILSIRVVTSVMSSAQMKIYMSPDEVPLSPEELAKVELVVRTTLSFITRNRLKDIVYDLAYFDEFGYPNLRFWNKSMMEILHTPAFVSKVFFRYNLRHFVLVNKEYGRPVGDRVMKTHFKGLEKLVGDGGFLGRLGGDNYIGFCDKAQMYEIIEYLNDTRVRIDENNSVKIKCSAGVFVVRPEFKPDDPGDLMEKLTMSFIIAQSGGKDQIVFFDESLLKGREKQMRVQQMFLDALNNHEFVPYYQPKVDVTTGRIVGGEALCRWIRGGKTVPPIEFIPALEQTNDICKLDMYMLERVCQNQRAWLDGGENRKLVPMSINFSRKHIMNLDFPDAVERIMDKYRIPHYAIEVELTETTGDAEFSDIRRVVTSFHEKGINTSIDDFGMGFSSLNILRDIPWSTVKVDKSFLPEDGDDENSEKSIMFRGVISMAKAMGYSCIAEGVETEYQVNIMRKYGCNIAQGYYYDKPLPKDEFEARLVTKLYEK